MGFSKDEILQKTNGGLDVIKRFYPQAKNDGKHFKIRDERTPSCSLKKYGNMYFLKDFGGGERGKNLFDIVMEENSLTFAEAVNWISNEFIDDSPKSLTRAINFKGAKMGIKSFSQSELNYWGKGITSHDLQVFGISSLAFYKGLKSTSDFFLFCYQLTDELIKINKPHDYDSRFFYIGNKKKNFVFGLKQLGEGVVRELIIASGEKDVINLSKYGYNAVCYNNESGSIPDSVISLLKNRCHDLYVCFDIDDAGKKAAEALCLRYPFIKMILLSEDLKKKKDPFRGRDCKDVADFFRFSSRAGFDELIDQACFLSGRFVFNDNLKFWIINKKNEVKFSRVGASRFLSKNGVFRYGVNSKELSFIRIQDNIVENIDMFIVQEILKKIAEKYGGDIVLEALIPSIQRSIGKNTSLLVNSKRELDFYTGKSDSQLFPFIGRTYRVTANGIESVRLKDFNFYIWRDQIINYSPILESDYFSLKNIGGSYSLEILDNSCDYFRFLIHTSNVYWRNMVKSVEQQNEEMLHLLSKITAIGYLLHGYKQSSCSVAIIAMDYLGITSGKAEGGTGKSLFGKVLEQIVSLAEVDGKKKNLLEDDTSFSRVTERTQIVHLDDIRRDFNLEMLFQKITGRFSVRRRYHDEFLMPEEQSIKFYITSNYCFDNTEKSKSRRVFNLFFSDYYEANLRSPFTEFGYEFFKVGMPEQQKNKFYNFMLQCVKAYLQFGLVKAPEYSVENGILIKEIGSEYLEWADIYFEDFDFKSRIVRRDFDQSFINYLSMDQARKIGKKKLKDKLKAYCKLKGYVFNPDQDGGIFKSNSVEYYRIVRMNSLKEVVSK